MWRIVPEGTCKNGAVKSRHTSPLRIRDVLPVSASNTAGGAPPQFMPTAKTTQIAKQLEEHVLCDVERVLFVPDQPVRQAVDTRMVSDDERLERFVISGRGALDQTVVARDTLFRNQVGHRAKR